MSLGNSLYNQGRHINANEDDEAPTPRCKHHRCLPLPRPLTCGRPAGQDPPIPPPLSSRHQLSPTPRPEMPSPTQVTPPPLQGPLPSRAFPVMPCLLTCVTFFLVSHPCALARFLPGGSSRVGFVPTGLASGGPDAIKGVCSSPLLPTAWHPASSDASQVGSVPPGAQGPRACLSCFPSPWHTVGPPAARGCRPGLLHQSLGLSRQNGAGMTLPLPLGHLGKLGIRRVH